MPVNGFLDKPSRSPLARRHHHPCPLRGRQIELKASSCPACWPNSSRSAPALPIVRLADSGKARTEEEFEQYLCRRKAPAVKPRPPETPPDFTIEGLALTNKPVKLFYGKTFKPTDTRRLNDLGDGGKVTVWGDVFATEVKGSRRKIYFTSITDYSGSVNLKVMGEEGADMSKWGGPQARQRPSSSAETICTTSTSMTLLSMPYDVFAGRALSSARIPRPTAKSASNCTCTPSPARWTASTIPARSCVWLHRMGHRAIAITDHGVCQGLPRRCWLPMPSTKQTRTSS